MSDLENFDKHHIWHPYTSLAGEPPIMIESANGVYLHASDGRIILDGISSWWVNLHGHSHPRIAEAISQQASKLEHVIFAGFTHEPAIELAQNLLSILPPNQNKIFYSDDGSTSVEVAIKMALQYWYNVGAPRKKIVALEGAYHGDTFGGMSVGDRGLFTKPFSNHLFDVEFLEFPDQENETRICDHLKSLAESDTVAAFIYEPLVQGAAGMRMYSAALLEKLLQTAQRNNIICIADEVFTGFGRTGKLFASDYLKVKPDVMCLSKGLTGGTLPLGVTSCSEKIVKAFESADSKKTFYHGHSFTANPLACAAANASFDLLTKSECKQQIAMIADSHKSFAESVRQNKKVKEARTIGTILAVELQTSEKTSYTNSLKKNIYDFFLNRNILLRPLGNVVYVVPPYVIKKEELQHIYDAISEFVGELK